MLKTLGSYCKVSTIFFGVNLLAELHMYMLSYMYTAEIYISFIDDTHYCCVQEHELRRSAGVLMFKRSLSSN